MLEQNAKVALGLFGNMLKNSLTRLGGLMMDVILQHQTVADVEEISEGNLATKWKSFVIPNIDMGGKTVTKKINFTPSSVPQSPYQMLEQEGGVDSETRIYNVNPEKWHKLKFQIVMETDEHLPKNETAEKILKQNAGNAILGNPVALQFVDPEAIVKDFLVEPLTRGNAEKYMRKAPVMMGPTAPAAPQPIPQQI